MFLFVYLSICCLYICLSVCLLVCLPICLPLYLCVCVSIHLSVVCLFVCLPVCLSVCLSTYLSVCLSTYLSACLLLVFELRFSALLPNYSHSDIIEVVKNDFICKFYAKFKPYFACLFSINTLIVLHQDPWTADGATGRCGAPAASPVCRELKSASGHVTVRLRPTAERFATDR